MENNKAEAIRAARRKARILNNSEGRINRILGQSTNDDKNNDDGNSNKISNSKNILQASTSNDILRNSNPTQQLSSPTSEEGCLQAPLTNNYTSTTDYPKIKSGASSNSSIIKDQKTSEKDPKKIRKIFEPNIILKTSENIQKRCEKDPKKI